VGNEENEYPIPDPSKTIHKKEIMEDFTEKTHGEAT
jgi:hypothetical protein